MERLDSALGIFFEDGSCEPDDVPDFGLADIDPSDIDDAADLFFKADGLESDIDGFTDIEPDESEPDDVMRMIVLEMMKQLPSADFLNLVSTWRTLANMPQPIPSGSGCTGSGMDHRVLTGIADVMEELTGIKVQFGASLVCESDPQKMMWLQHYLDPSCCEDDVCSLADSTSAPTDLFAFNLGFSCKDLSTLNRFSLHFRDECSDTERDVSSRGTTGKTWAGCLGFVAVIKPLILWIENVRAALQGKNWSRIEQDLKEQGYTVVGVCLNTAKYGIPQHRQRAYIVAVHNRMPVYNMDRCKELILHLECTPYPIEAFLLSDNHPYIKEFMEKKRNKVALMQAKAQLQLNPKKVSKRWIVDHWKTRRNLNLRVHSHAAVEKAEAITTLNALTEREQDMLNMVCSMPVAMHQHASLELKHSASRVLKHGKTVRHETTCLLPSSRMLLLQHQPQRLLTGLEALHMQGIPVPAMLQASRADVADDKLFMSMAGNAFSSGPCAAVMIATLAAITLPDDLDL